MTDMTNIQAQGHVKECRRMLNKASRIDIKDKDTAYCIGALMIAIEQLAEVVDDLAHREQSKATA